MIHRSCDEGNSSADDAAGLRSPTMLFLILNQSWCEILRASAFSRQPTA
jgi:hypothetical protein